MNVFELIEKHGIELHGDIEYFAELIRQDEREACERLCLQGTGLPIQTDALRIMTAERERIAMEIRKRGESNE